MSERGDYVDIQATTDDIADALSVLNITLARVYDVLMVNLHLTNPEVAAELDSTHSNGKFLGAPPQLDDNPFG